MISEDKQKETRERTEMEHENTILIRHYTKEIWSQAMDLDRLERTDFDTEQGYVDKVFEKAIVLRHQILAFVDVVGREQTRQHQLVDMPF